MIARARFLIVTDPLWHMPGEVRVVVAGAIAGAAAATVADARGF